MMKKRTPQSGDVTPQKACLAGVANANKIFFYETIDSTNSEAKRRAAKGAPDGTVILADCQTAGRGRLGRSFYSPPGSGIYLSVLLRPELPMEDIVLITVAASVAVGRAICSVVGRYPQIKWVNDLYMEGKKVCGILAEAVSLPDSEGSAVVIGVGINCTTIFPAELQEIAGNLPMPISGGEMRQRLLAELIKELGTLEEMIRKNDFIEEYRRHSMVLGREVVLPQEPGSRYYVKGIGDRGELILVDEKEKERVLSSGEISIRLR